jgi:hypothetical protein
MMSFFTHKVPTGAWNILKAAGFKYHSPPHGGKVVYILVPLTEVKNHYATAQPLDAAAPGLPPHADAAQGAPLQ